MPSPRSSSAFQGAHQEPQTTTWSGTPCEKPVNILQKQEGMEIRLKIDQWNLDDMVPEINFFSFFSGSVFYVEHANEICCPAPQQAVEELKEYAR